MGGNQCNGKNTQTTHSQFLAVVPEIIIGLPEWIYRKCAISGYVSLSGYKKTYIRIWYFGHIAQPYTELVKQTENEYLEISQNRDHTGVNISTWSALTECQHESLLYQPHSIRIFWSDGPNICWCIIRTSTTKHLHCLTQVSSLFGIQFKCYCFQNADTFFEWLAMFYQKKQTHNKWSATPVQCLGFAHKRHIYI